MSKLVGVISLVVLCSCVSSVGTVSESELTVDQESDALCKSVDRQTACVSDGTAQATLVLGVVNDATDAVLRGTYELSKSELKALHAFRDGPDQRPTTGDDRRFASIAELRSLAHLSCCTLARIARLAAATHECRGDDGVCPTVCNATTDSNCAPVCGNGVLEKPETCDGTCPTSCDDGQACTADVLTGSSAHCDAVCAHEPIAACTSGDGCCPAGCTTRTDSDCPLPTWQVQVAAYTGGAFSSLALDEQGDPLVVYTSDNQGRGLFMTALHHGTWAPPETIDTNVNAFDPSIVHTSTGWLELNSNLTVTGSTFTSSAQEWRRGAAATWSWATTVANLERTHLAQSAAHEYLLGENRFDQKVSGVYFTMRSTGASSWPAPLWLSSKTWGSKIAVTPSGHIFVAYIDNAYALWLAESTNGSSWDFRQVSTEQIYEVVLTTDASGAAVLVAYSNTRDGLFCEKWHAGTKLSSATVELAGGPAPGSTHYSGLSVAIDAEGATHVSYLDFTRNQAVRYATDSGHLGWFVNETVATSDDVLGSTSLAVAGPTATTPAIPHISFPSSSTWFENLGYAVKR